MGFRSIIIQSKSKLSYGNGYMLIRNEELKRIFLDEVNLIMIESMEVVMTSYLIWELSKRKIKVIICDPTHNPSCEIVPYYGSHNTSLKVREQCKWDDSIMEELWTRIIEEKINNQLLLLKEFNIDMKRFYDYKDDLTLGDPKNIEGLIAKEYFAALFGRGFSRERDPSINGPLNYGYTVLLSYFNREIVSKGYVTQLGIKHKNQFNQFNLSCDLMEPFRPVVDQLVIDNIGRELDSPYKDELVSLLNKKVTIKGKAQQLSNAITIYLDSIFNSLSTGNLNDIVFGDIL